VAALAAGSASRGCKMAAEAPPQPFLGPNVALGGVSVGDEAVWERRVSTEHVEAYAQITGDRNPLHFSTEFAEGTVFKKPYADAGLITHGGIQSGALNALVAQKVSRSVQLPSASPSVDVVGTGTRAGGQGQQWASGHRQVVWLAGWLKACCCRLCGQLPGPGSVFMSQELKYVAPVRVGDLVRACGKVVKVGPGRGGTRRAPLPLPACCPCAACCSGCRGKS
jgi:acyl dehydratase